MFSTGSKRTHRPSTRETRPLSLTPPWFHLAWTELSSVSCFYTVWMSRSPRSCLNHRAWSFPRWPSLWLVSGLIRAFACQPAQTPLSVRRLLLEAAGFSDAGTHSAALHARAGPTLTSPVLPAGQQWLLWIIRAKFSVLSPRCSVCLGCLCRLTKAFSRFLHFRSCCFDLELELAW